mmetsp:Transcript_43688/g.120944  ORF Transcript_43688/g.120944 Transcript_43688/m.120944 type:complete len:323 (-) Transcript_43688:136-1104(-)
MTQIACRAGERKKGQHQRQQQRPPPPLQQQQKEQPQRLDRHLDRPQQPPALETAGNVALGRGAGGGAFSGITVALAVAVALVAIVFALVSRAELRRNEQAEGVFVTTTTAAAATAGETPSREANRPNVPVDPSPGVDVGFDGVVMIVDNPHPSMAAHLFWFEPGSRQEMLQGVVEPSSTVRAKTFPGHVFLLRAGPTSAAQLLSTCVATAMAEQLCTLRPEHETSRTPIDDESESGAHGSSRTVIVENRHRRRPAYLFWVDPDGSGEQFQEMIEPWSQVQLYSFVGHVFIARVGSDPDSKLIRRCAVTGEQEQRCVLMARST